MSGPSATTSGNNFSFQTGHEATSPWEVQTPYLKSAFNRAEDAYNKTMAQGPYSGDYVAQGGPESTAAFTQAFDFGSDPRVQEMVRGMLGTSSGLMSDGAGWIKQGAEGLSSLAGDQTDNIIANASKYADNPYIAGMINAIREDASRQASENAIPSLYRGAAGNNALNSDRAALSQGVVERGVNDFVGKAAADIRYNAYDKGLSTAKGEMDSRRGAYGSLGSLGLGAFGQGTSGFGAGIGAQQDLNQMAATGAEGLRTLKQLGLDNEMAKYQGQANFPWAALQNYYSLVGDKSWGGTRDWSQAGIGSSTETKKVTPGITDYMGATTGGLGSLFAAPMGGTSAMGGLLGYLGGKPGTMAPY